MSGAKPRINDQKVSVNRNINSSRSNILHLYPMKYLDFLNKNRLINTNNARTEKIAERVKGAIFAIPRIKIA